MHKCQLYCLSLRVQPTPHEPRLEDHRVEDSNRVYYVIISQTVRGQTYIVVGHKFEVTCGLSIGIFTFNFGLF